MLMDSSRRRSPSIVIRPISSRIFSRSASDRSLIFFEYGMPTFSQIFCAVGRPMP
jgi:hypothetical protein